MCPVMKSAVADPESTFLPGQARATRPRSATPTPSLNGGDISAAGKIRDEFGKPLFFELRFEIGNHISQVSRRNGLD